MQVGTINQRRPRQVALAVGVLGFLVVVQLAWSLVDIYQSWAASGTERIVLFSTFFKSNGPIVGFALVAFLLIKIFQGRNWARIIYAVIVCAEAAIITLVYTAHLYVPAHEMAYDIVAFVVQAFAVVLLFVPPGKSWFATLRN
jgi:hypothetical protein